jgi:hypothetical protein
MLYLGSKIKHNIDDNEAPPAKSKHTASGTFGADLTAASGLGQCFFIAFSRTSPDISHISEKPYNITQTM